MRGYRAPTWSITRQAAWAIDVLAELRFDYDASIFPVGRAQYGIPQAPDRPFFVQHMPQGPLLLELPPLTWRQMGRNLPVAGGEYFRMLPLTLMKHGLKQAAADNRPAVLYFQPWEFDPQMPRLPLPLTSRLRTYTGLRSSFKRLEQILRFGKHWQTLGDSLEPCRTLAQQTGVFTLQQHLAA